MYCFRFLISETNAKSDFLDCDQCNIASEIYTAFWMLLVIGIVFVLEV